jgi:hypothetical protein
VADVVHTGQKPVKGKLQLISGKVERIQSGQIDFSFEKGRHTANLYHYCREKSNVSAEVRGS